MKLEPCPFCSGEATMEVDEGRRGTSRHSCIVVCMHCGLKFETNEEGDKSGTEWNEHAGRIRLLTELLEQVKKTCGQNNCNCPKSNKIKELAAFI